MKSLFLTLLFLSCVTSVVAQEKIWLNKKGEWTEDSAKAVRYAIITSQAGQSTQVEVFSMDGQKKEIGQYSKYKDTPRKRIRDGVYRYLYTNGQDSAVNHFKGNKLEGQCLTYFPDGSTRFIKIYNNGQLNGKLQQYYPSGKLRRYEEYTNGRRIDGKLYAEDGSKLKYEPYMVMPEFPGGMEAFVLLLKNIMKYPKEAQQVKAEGRVLIQIMIDKDGTMTSPTLLQKVHPALDAEAIRVVNAIAQTYKWSPGRQDGETKRVKYVLPINFRLPQKNKLWQTFIPIYRNSSIT
ncbi:MAG: TonB family protein [Bacteroides sp.]|nr:TonB family protein [Bacteroides sp.]